MLSRFLLVSVTLLLLLTAARAGRYQRTKDRHIRVWNEHPEQWDEAVWTGERDETGSGTGAGTLTWYRIAKNKETGTMIPFAARGHDLQVVGSFSGTMTQGRFEGTVVTTDNAGKKLQAKFADGSRAGPWTLAGATSEKPTQPTGATDATAVASAKKEDLKPPAEGPSQIVHRSAVVDAPTQDSHTLEVFRPPSSLRASYAAPTPQTSSSAAKAVGPTVVDLKRETDGVLLQVRDATSNWHDIDALDSVQPLPPPVRDAVRSLADRAKSARSNTGDNSATRAQVETVDALGLVNDATRALAAKDASTADSKLSQFLKNHPSPPGDNQKDLWRYLTTTQWTCDRHRKEANTHLQRAQLLVTADEVDQAIDEYTQANKLFPTQTTTDRIRQLSARSASLTSP